MFGLYILLVIILVAIFGTAIYFILRFSIRRRLYESLSTSLFLIKIPRSTSEDSSQGTEGKDFKSELAHFEQLLSGLAAVKRSFAFEVAVPHVGEEIHFYLSIPKLMSEVAIKQIQGLWNGASVEPVADDL